MLFLIARPDFEWVASAEILTEYRAVLRRPKFALPEALLFIASLISPWYLLTTPENHAHVSSLLAAYL